MGAAADGVVTFAGRNGAYGTAIYIDRGTNASGERLGITICTPKSK